MHYTYDRNAGTVAIVVGPASEPVSLDEAKTHLRVSGPDEDAYLTSLLKAARQTVEVETARALMTQTLRQTFDGFPGRHKPMVLRRAPVQSITSVTYVDTAGTTQTWATGQWAFGAGEPATIRPAYGVGWPVARGHAGTIAVTYVAGFGEIAAVPELAKAAIRLLLGHWYENRQEVTVGSVATEVPRAAASIINLLKWGNYP